MKRAHRKWHRRAWWLVAPAAALVIWMALAVRQELSTNKDWPAFLAKPSTTGGG